VKQLVCSALLIGSLAMYGCGTGERSLPMSAGFARVKITPPLGTPMTGFGGRDYDPAGCRGVHDDLYVRALYLSQGGEQALVMGFDLLFFSRDEADRFKGAIGRVLDIAPPDILLNTSHTHTGPKVGTWFYTPSDPFYLDFLEDAIVEAAVRARENTREVTVWAGKTTSSIPMSRRKKLPNGVIDFAPNPDGPVCDTLPVCLLRDASGDPVCLLFSISCHPSTVKGVERSYWISADFPGPAMAKLDEHLGAAASLFLQGAGGDAKPSVIGKGEEHWRAGTWDDVEAAGRTVAEEVIALLDRGLTRVEPGLRSETIDMEWPFAEALTREDYEDIIANPQAHAESMPEVMQAWAGEQIARLDRGFEQPDAVSITAHGLRIGDGVRLVGIEGELVAELGLLILDRYAGGVTFPMGYTDGAQLYLPTSAMLDEGGYEVESWWEYRQPAPLAKGHEAILTDTVRRLQERGID